MRFGVLGPLTVWAEDGAVVAVPEKKVRALLAMLLLDRGRVVSADRLIDGIWGESAPVRPAGALQTLVSRLRRALSEAGSNAVVYRAMGYVLDVPAESVDEATFAALVEQARQTGDPRKRAAWFTEALGHWRGDPFADFADELFAQPAVARLTEQRLLVVEELAETRLLMGEYGPVAAELTDLAERHPLRERLRGAQMRALYGAGRLDEALAVFHDVRRLLDAELGLEPGATLTELHQQILRADPAALPAEPAVGSDSSARPPSNLPAPLTDLIGRESSLRQVLELLDQERLVTLTGPGGVGKTRLAVAAASESAQSYPHGVWLVELGGIVLPSVTSAAVDSLADIVAAALGIRDNAPPARRGSRSAQYRLADALQDCTTLIVLDNCEHVIGGAALLVRQIVRRAPSVRVLATSREPLDIEGERLWQVPPLDLPGPAATFDEIVASGAVRLFAARAAAAAPGFTLGADNAAAVATVCRRMDGLPLALELASTRVRALGPARLAERLDDRFGLLTGGRRDAPPRQQTLRAMIDWSWELLTAAEQVVLRRLSIHADGCTLDAAETLCAAAGVKSEEVLDLLARLVDRSLLVVVHDDDEPRYRLLESISAYCAERLRASTGQVPAEFEQLRLAHAGYYADLAERAYAHLRGPRQRYWMSRLDAESANLRRALDTATTTGDALLAQRIALALTWYWFLRGRLGEARRSIADVLAVVDDEHRTVSARARLSSWRAAMTLLAGDGAESLREDGAFLRLVEEIRGPGERAVVGWFLGYAVTMFGAMEAGVQIIDRALDELRELDDGWGIAAALTVRAIQRLSRGDLDTAWTAAEQSLALFGEIGEQWGRLQATGVLATLLEIRGDYPEAEARHRDGLRIAEDLGLWSEAASRWAQLGRIALLRHDYPLADELHDRARQLAVAHADRPAMEIAEVGLAMSARRQGKFETAQTLLRRWLDWNLGFDAANGAALILAELGFAAEQCGDVEGALELHRQGMAAAERTGDPRAIALANEGLAGAHSLAGAPVLAARLLGSAARTRAAIGATLPPAELGDVERVAERVRSMLGEMRFAAEFAKEP
ncbi:AfsR/SARP family transcriptional regulator [Nocardia cyriacigeorgica]|uniref:AfsR/SARP family transcriptional regulator n=1 Tax=Nocardia cyriacigeorgica TaxID=135487 RepID=A0ABX0CNK9_9NOCA|nr:BTAD domain-containing putative transcriptional regulator [Nocardia cyriacigeorgica]NEW57048.1 AfsR/SARP family transcriptional regulator [Nocardia cyriacigeorgica]